MSCRNKTYNTWAKATALRVTMQQQVLGGGTAVEIPSVSRMTSRDSLISSHGKQHQLKLVNTTTTATSATATSKLLLLPLLQSGSGGGFPSSQPMYHATSIRGISACQRQESHSHRHTSEMVHNSELSRGSDKERESSSSSSSLAPPPRSTDGSRGKHPGRTVISRQGQGLTLAEGT